MHGTCIANFVSRANCVKNQHVHIASGFNFNWVQCLYKIKYTHSLYELHFFLWNS